MIRASFRDARVSTLGPVFVAAAADYNPHTVALQGEVHRQPNECRQRRAKCIRSAWRLVSRPSISFAWRRGRWSRCTATTGACGQCLSPQRSTTWGWSLTFTRPRRSSAPRSDLSITPTSTNFRSSPVAIQRPKSFPRSYSIESASWAYAGLPAWRLRNRPGAWLVSIPLCGWASLLASEMLGSWGFAFAGWRLRAVAYLRRRARAAPTSARRAMTL